MLRLISTCLFFLATPALAEEPVVTSVCTQVQDCDFVSGLAEPKRVRLQRKGFGQPQDKGIYIEKNTKPYGALIHFDYDKARLQRRSLPMLDKLAGDLLHGELRNAVLQVSGHADSTGEDWYHLDLSERRARSVVHYLGLQGVAPERLRLAAYGESKSICPNDTEAQRAWNRRVEFARAGTLDPQGRLARAFTPSPGTELDGDCNSKP